MITKNNKGLFNIGTVLAMNRSNDEEYSRQLLALNDSLDPYGLALTPQQTRDPAFNLPPASGYFPMSQFSASGGQSI